MSTVSHSLLETTEKDKHNCGIEARWLILTHVWSEMLVLLVVNAYMYTIRSAIVSAVLVNPSIPRPERLSSLLSLWVEYRPWCRLLLSSFHLYSTNFTHIWSVSAQGSFNHLYHNSGEVTHGQHLVFNLSDQISLLGQAAPRSGVKEL